MQNIKTASDLRSVLAEEITALRQKKRTPAEVNAITNASGKILASIRMELEYNKLLGLVPKIPFIGITDGQLKRLRHMKPKTK